MYKIAAIAITNICRYILLRIEKQVLVGANLRNSIMSKSSNFLLILRLLSHVHSIVGTVHECRRYFSNRSERTSIIKICISRRINNNDNNNNKCYIRN